MKDYIEKAMRTCSPGFHKELVGTNALHGAIGVATEAGELLDAVKKALFYGKPVDETNILEECGDILWYMAAIADHYGFTFEQAMERNIAKLKKRYPEKFTEEFAEHRDLTSERKALEGDEAFRRDQKAQMDAIKRGKSNADEPSY